MLAYHESGAMRKQCHGYQQKVYVGDMRAYHNRRLFNIPYAGSVVRGVESQLQERCYHYAGKVVQKRIWFFYSLFFLFFAHFSDLFSLVITEVYQITRCFGKAKVPAPGERKRLTEYLDSNADFYRHSNVSG